MKQILLIFVCILQTFGTFAQNRHHIDITFGRHKTFKTYKRKNNKEGLMTIQFKYQYDISNRLSIYANYTRTPIFSSFIASTTYWFDTLNIGKLYTWDKYLYYDLGIQYQLYKVANHQLSGFAAISYAKGKNSYLKNMSWIPTPNTPPGFAKYHILFAEYEDQDAQYWGAVAGLAYDYYFLKDRFAIGANFAARYYIGNFPFQLNYGLKLGVNF